MPKFYFHLHDDVDVPDDEGVDLSDLEAAQTYAVHCARVTFGESAKDEGRVVLHHRIAVATSAAVVSVKPATTKARARVGACVPNRHGGLADSGARHRITGGK